MSFWWSTLTFSISIAIISFYCVLSLPLFANQRTRNDSSHILSVIMSCICIIFLLFEIRNTCHRICEKIYCLWDKLKCGYRFVKAFLLCQQRNIVYEQMEVSCELNLLATFFFGGYISCDFAKIINEIYFEINLPHCFQLWALCAYICELFLGIFISIAIFFKDFSMEKTFWRCFCWSCLGAVCFGSAFKFLTEEVGWGYIDIVIDSINDPEFGLNITNITNAADYVPLIFKLQTECFEQGVFASPFAEFLIELIPFSTEYFSLATFFCFFTWKNLDDSHLNPHQPVEVATVNFYVCNDSSFFSRFFIIKFWPKCIWILLLCLPTAVSLFFFYHVENGLDYLTGTSIHVYQQLIYRVVLMLELPFYYIHMKKMPSLSTPPHHFQLDIILLTLPVLPLGILYVLGSFPDIIHYWMSQPNQLPYTDPIWIVLNAILKIFSWTQVVLQSIFISEVFCRIKFGSMSKFGNFFQILAAVNLCIWVSWTLECKLTTIHSRNFIIYGFYEWIIVVYSTVPFVLFGFAHATACFLEISRFIYLKNFVPVNQRDRAQSV